MSAVVRKQLQFLGVLLLISFLISSTLTWFFEKPHSETIGNFGDVIWWWLVTSTTVGYGDIFPVTGIGRVAGVITMITGIFCYTVIISLVNDQVREFLNKNRLGTAQVTSRGHIVVCEYTAFADELLQSIPEYEELKDREVVVITDLVGLNPYGHIRFVHGVPISPASLNQANVAEADYVFVFSNARFTKPDLKTLHITSRIQKLNSRAEIFVELEEPDSPSTKRLPREIVVLGTKDLLETVIGGEGIDLSEFFRRRDL